MIYLRVALALTIMVWIGIRVFHHRKPHAPILTEDKEDDKYTNIEWVIKKDFHMYTATDASNPMIYGWGNTQQEAIRNAIEDDIELSQIMKEDYFDNVFEMDEEWKLNLPCDDIP